MIEEGTRSVAEAFLGALLRHDREPALAMLHADATIFVTGRNVLSGTFDSAQHFALTRNWIFQEHDAGVDVIRCKQLLVEETTAVALVDERAHRDTAELIYSRLIVMTIEEGKIAELRLVAEDPYALDVFWE